MFFMLISDVILKTLKRNYFKLFYTNLTAFKYCACIIFILRIYQSKFVKYLINKS